MTHRPATQKQFSFIKSLLADREISAELQHNVDIERGNAQRGVMTAVRASALIDTLLAQPKKTEGSVATQEMEAGVYSYAGDQYVRVYLGQQSGKMLAKRIHIVNDDNEWVVSYEYLGLASKVLAGTDPQRLSLEEVGSMGLAFNHCLICGRRLDDPESVDRGVGPVCASKY